MLRPYVCGAALAAVESPPDAIRRRGPLLVVVCGGAGVSLDLLRKWDSSVT